MKNYNDRSKPNQSAFTLIEILAVIAIIATLAALVIPLSKHVGKTKRIKLAQAELSQIQIAIEAYKAKNGFYPPDNTRPSGLVNAVTNQLYYELVGTVLTNNSYVTLDGSSQLPLTSFLATYGPITTVKGFMNSSQSSRSSDETAAAANYLKGLRPNQIGQLNVNGASPRILVCSIPWPDDLTAPIPSSVAQEQPGQNLNPWRYVSSNPTNNPGSYDLWVDLLFNGQTNRISNWSKQPLVYQ